MLAYAQSASREGVDAALDGVVIAQADPRFSELRALSTEINVKAKPHLVGRVQVKVARGHVRLELPGSESDSAQLSPICVFTTAPDAANADVAVANATRAVTLIGRTVNADELRAGFAAAAQLVAAGRRRTVAVVVAVAGVLAAAALIVQFVANQAAGH